MLKTRSRNLVYAVVASALGDGLIPTAFAIQSFQLDSSGRLLTFVLIALWSAKLISSLALDKVLTPPSCKAHGGLRRRQCYSPSGSSSLSHSFSEFLETGPCNFIVHLWGIRPVVRPEPILPNRISSPWGRTAQIEFITIRDWRRTLSCRANPRFRFNHRDRLQGRPCYRHAHVRRIP